MDRLAELTGREEAAGVPAPETMRKLMHAILAYQAEELRDDATAVLVEWQGVGATRIVPAGSSSGTSNQSWRPAGD